jgi:superoxide reductase
MIGEKIQHADWKNEKHVPVIECPDTVKADEVFEVKVTLGKEVAHPNTTEHHIRWINVYFHPDDEKFTYDVGRIVFGVHGESTEGADEGPVYTHHSGTFTMKTKKPGVIYAVSHCNIHGLWENEKEIKLG